MRPIDWCIFLFIYGSFMFVSYGVIQLALEEWEYDQTNEY